MKGCGCIDQNFDFERDGEIESFEWNDEKCTDAIARDGKLKLQNQKRILNKRTEL